MTTNKYQRMIYGLELLLFIYQIFIEGLQAFGASQVVLAVKNPPANVGDIRDVGSIPGSGRPPGGGHGNPLQCCCLENPQGQRSPVGYSPWDGTESDTTEQPSRAQEEAVLQ